MGLTERTAITLPKGMRQEALELGINISGTAALAIRDRIELLKKKRENDGH